jgi:glycosyltransferase involved in cell wall biosynthesis
VKVAFLVNDLQLFGGVAVVVAHARQLERRHGIDVSLVLTHEQERAHWEHEELEGLTVSTLAEARHERYDIAVSTWWETAYSLFDVRAARYVSFVQSIEERFYRPGTPQRLDARLSLDLPVTFITEASWIKHELAERRPDARCHLVRNGVDKGVFTPPPTIERRPDGPLRILVEGNPHLWFKGVNEAIDAVRRMREPHHLTVVATHRENLVSDGADVVVGPVSQREMAALYAQTDVLLKLSRVEGMAGPPLEAFHLGATCVTAPMTGSDEYVRNGVNALLTDWDDPAGTAAQLDRLAVDRELLHGLRLGALETARAWPTWEESGAEMAGALRVVAAEPAADVAPALSRLLANTRAALAEERRRGKQGLEVHALRHLARRVRRLLPAHLRDRPLPPRLRAIADRVTTRHG